MLKENHIFGNWVKIYLGFFLIFKKLGSFEGKLERFLTSFDGSRMWKSYENEEKKSELNFFAREGSNSAI